MKVQLFNPPVHHYAGVHYRINPPLGLPYIAAVLDEVGITCQVVDLEALKISPAQFANQYREQERNWPDAVGFTITTHNQRGAQDCIRALWGIGYDGYIMVGGPQVTIDPKPWAEFLGDTEDRFGVAIRGECEGNIVACLNARPSGVFEGQTMAMERLPTPLWRQHNPPPRYYYGNLPKIGHPEGIAMFSRGCPHQCIFCGNPVFGGQRIRFLPPANVRRDLLVLKEFGVQSVFAYDDEIVGAGRKQNAWIEAVADMTEDLGLTIKGQGRCSKRFVDKRTLKNLYRAGFRAIMWGVESFSEKVLRAIRKGTTEEDIWHTLRLSKEVGLGNWIFLMVGNYGETVEDLAHTEAAMSQANREGLVDWRQVTVCTPLPGTQLWQWAEEEGWLTKPPEVGPQMAQVFGPTKWLTVRQITDWKRRLENA